MGVYTPFRVVRETASEIEIVYGCSDEQLLADPRSVTLDKAGAEDPERWNPRFSHPDEAGRASGAVGALVRARRRRGDGTWPRAGAQQS